MMLCRFILSALLMLSFPVTSMAQQANVGGRVVDDSTGDPVAYASLLIDDNGLWAVSDESGNFNIKGVPTGRVTISVQCLGYQKRSWTITVTAKPAPLKLRLRPQNLKLDEVTVTARRKNDEATTSYSIGRQSIDQQQVLNLSDLSALLPGGKTVNPTLMSDARLSLRSGSQEKGNASFGTAIEIDGMRMDNNAAAGETMGASTRTISSADIENVEIVSGIPSVEYGDLSNGVVKVFTRKGKSPFIVEGKLNQHTRQVAVSKGFDFGRHRGVLNASVEHARSFSDAASPHTAYQRNILSLNYSNTLMRQTTPLTLNVGVTGNIGGYNSEADPDNELDDYSKARDNAIRAHFDTQWLLNRPLITNLQMSGSLSYSDRRQENYTHANSASTQPYLHTTTEGYYMAQYIAEGQTPTAEQQAGIILSPTGYWYVLGYNDSKPMSWALKLKGQKNSQLTIGKTALRSRLLVGAEYTGSHNEGRGKHYADMRLAPTWREYRYDQLPAMHNMALYAEAKLSLPTTKHSTAELTAGLRDDITMISGSDYGTVSSLSPRANTRYIFWRNMKKRHWVSDLQMHAGWGKSVKLPSFQVLYPAPSYSDLLVFASTSTADNRSFYAYHTQPVSPQYNAGLRWQYTNQTDLGVELTLFGTRISLSAFHHKTCRSYMSARTYTPFTYRYTGQTAVQGSGIAAENRTFAIDPATGTVTVGDATGQKQPVELPYTDKRTYTTNPYYTGATPLSRYGLEWIIDFATIRMLRTQLRIDGNYYEYKGTDDVLFADVPLGVSNVMSDGMPYQYVGYYRGSSVTGAGMSANASVSNGTLTRQANVNATATTHIPRLRLVVALRLESTLVNYRRALSELSGGSRGYVLEDGSDNFGVPYDGKAENQFIAVYPEYYTTWDEPDRMIPFAEAFADARDNNPALYSELAKLVVRSNYAYTMNPNRLSAYYSANLSVTKEIGDHISVSFYANNFFNNMRRVHSSQTDLETSLFGSSYIPSFYYGLSLKLKIN